jgi:SAM-dependent methyltransferase
MSAREGPSRLRGYGPTSYGEAFADVYDDWYQDISDVAATVTRVRVLADGGPVLELGVGTGRLALPLAEAGVETWGVDASGAMLARLRAKPGGTGLRVVQADMAAPGLAADGRFAVVFCAYNTFFNLTEPEAQAACLRWAATALAHDGRLVIEAFVPAGREAEDGRTVSVRSVDANRVVLSVAQRDPDAQVIAGQFVDLSEAGRRLRPYRIHYLFPDQLDALAAEAGLALVAREATWVGAPFTDKSPNHVSIYARAHPFPHQAQSSSATTACTAGTMTSQSAPSSRLTVRKSAVPNSITTPGMAKMRSAKGLPIAASALRTSSIASKVTSRVNFMALGLGVGDGSAEAMARP